MQASELRSCVGCASLIDAFLSWAASLFELFGDEYDPPPNYHEPQREQSEERILRDWRFQMNRATISILIATALLITGCVFGSVVVMHEFGLRASAINDSDGAQAREIQPVTTELKDRIGLASTIATFESKSARWEVFTTDDEIGFAVKNKLSTPITVRLDNLLIATNFSPEFKPLMLAKESRHRRIPNPTDLTLEKPRPERIEPGADQRITIDPDYTTLFPNKTLFNVKHVFGSATITDVGIGNSMSIDLPVEAATGNERIRIELKLTKSSARLINF
jgi:hypothetical protein